MGLSASQGRLLLLTARRSDLEFRAQQISQKRLNLSQQLEEVSLEYENATSNRQMKIALFLNGDNTSTDSTTRTSNLTYAALVSGTVSMGLGSDVSGIQSYSRTEGQEFSSTTAYRLVSVDGAIVVSDKKEIPETTLTENVTTAPATEKSKNVYTSKTTTIDIDENGTASEGVVSNEKTWVVAAKTMPELDENGNETGKEVTSDLSKALADNDQLAVKIQDSTVEVTSGTGTKTYYNAETGRKLSDDEVKELVFNGQDATLVGSLDDVAKNETIENTTSSTELVEGSDGTYSVIGKDGVKRRYIVDPTLKYGSTDVNSAASGPNYLQDCLRNGKYLIEKYVQDDTLEDGYKWSSVSWDATANISDHYYTEDDDAAKAKYDRLQSQIQAQDKKLELELDNIETQRNAVTTEVESVDKVISDDVESTFNAFG